MNGPGLRLATRDMEPATQTKNSDPGSSIQDLDKRLRTKNPDTGRKICNQGSGFILHPIWICLARMIFVIWK